VAKFSDPDYFLPVIEALEVGKILTSGRTSPTRIRGVCRSTSIKSDYVVKFRGSPEMYPGASCKELIAAFIGMELGFNMPSPVIINISETLQDTIRQAHYVNSEIILRSAGYNFGTCYVEGYQEPMREQVFPEELLPEFANLLALDIFWGNPDRRIDKPNFLTNGKHLLIYDHELAFSFTDLIFPVAAPWLIPPGDLTWISKNYCFNLLKGKNVDFSIFVGQLNKLNNDFWEKVATFIPIDWNTGLVEKIKTHLASILENSNDFAAALNRILL